MSSASSSQERVNFDDRYLSEKRIPGSSRASSKVRSEIETPHGPLRRESVQSLAALSVAADPRVDPREPAWPRDWRAYTCLFGGFLLMFNSWGIVNAYGTYASYYMQVLLPGQDILLFNLVGSTQSFVVLILSAIVGRFLDAGYSRHLVACGTVLVALGSFLLSIVNGETGNYGLIWLTQGFVSALGMACFFVTSSQVVATWFKAKKGFAIGIVASGASIAGLVYPYMLRQLIRTHGFNNAQRYVSTVTTITAALAIVIARPNPAHHIRKPETWFRVRVFIDTHAFRNRSFVWLVTAICFMFFGFYSVFFNLEQWAVSKGFGFRALNTIGAESGLPSAPASGQIHSFWLLAIMNASSTIGRLGSAYLCDHFGALNVHAVVMAIASLLVLLLWTMASDLSSALAFVVVFGAFSGAVIGLPPASVAYILGPDPLAQAKLGQWTGMMYSTAAIFALTGPVIAGHLITHYDTFLTVQCWAGGCLAVSAMCLGMAIWCRQRPAVLQSSAPEPKEQV